MQSSKKLKEVHIRFTEDEYARVQVQAKATGKSTTSFIRAAALNEGAVHIVDGKQVAQKIGQLHNKIILYQNDIRNRIQELQEAVEEHTRLINTYGSACFSSSEVQEVRKLFDMRVWAAVDTIKRTYSEHENRTEEALHAMLENSLRGGI